MKSYADMFQVPRPIKARHLKSGMVLKDSFGDLK